MAKPKAALHFPTSGRMTMAGGYSVGFGPPLYEREKRPFQERIREGKEPHLLTEPEFELHLLAEPMAEWWIFGCPQMWKTVWYRLNMLLALGGRDPLPQPASGWGCHSYIKAVEVQRVLLGEIPADLAEALAVLERWTPKELR